MPRYAQGRGYAAIKGFDAQHVARGACLEPGWRIRRPSHNRRTDVGDRQHDRTDADPERRGENGEDRTGCLARKGFRTVCACNGRAILDIYCALKPNLLLVDVSMKRSDGWNVVATRPRVDTIRVVKVTARRSGIDKLRIG